MTVFDASALLAFIQGETGAALVEQRLGTGGSCSTANWSEIIQKTRARSGNWPTARLLLLAYGLTLEPVTEADAEAAAARWVRGDGRSLADRLCLSLADRLDVEVLTADQSWGSDGRVRQIR